MPLCYMNLDTGETTFSEWQAVCWSRDGFKVQTITERGNDHGNHLEHRQARSTHGGFYGRPVRIRLHRRPGSRGLPGACAVVR